MAELYRKRYNGVDAVTLGAAISSSGATSITFAAALQSMGANIATLAADEYLPLVIDNEIIYLTAYTAAATTGTISRGKEGTTAATHSNGASVVHGSTVRDFGGGGGWPGTSPDTAPAIPHAQDDEFDGTSPASWTTTPSAPPVMNVNSTAAGRLYVESTASSSALRGRYQTAPSAPFAFAVKLASHTATGGSSRTGIYVGPTGAIAGGTAVQHFSWVNNAGGVQRVTQQFDGTFIGNGSTKSLPSQPLYLACAVHSATAVTFFASTNGRLWSEVDHVNPGFTVGIIGVYVSSESWASIAASQFEWFRVAA